MRFTRLPAAAAAALTLARSAVAVIRDPSLSDDDKERLTRRNAVRMLGAFVRIALLAAVALASPLVALWALDAIGVAPMRETIASMTRWEGIAVVSIAALAFWAVEWAFSRAKRN